MPPSTTELLPFWLSGCAACPPARLRWTNSRIPRRGRRRSTSRPPAERKSEREEPPPEQDVGERKGRLYNAQAQAHTPLRRPAHARKLLAVLWESHGRRERKQVLQSPPASSGRRRLPRGPRRAAGLGVGGVPARAPAPAPSSPCFACHVPPPLQRPPLLFSMLLGASWLCSSKAAAAAAAEKRVAEERRRRRAAGGGGGGGGGGGNGEGPPAAAAAAAQAGSAMDESSLLDLLECSVCLERLDTTAKVLPCQHTFCRRCLESIVSSRHELRCPECRILVGCGVDELPANILLVRLLDGIRQRPRAAAGGGGGDGGGSPTAQGNAAAAATTGSPAAAGGSNLGTTTTTPPGCHPGAAAAAPAGAPSPAAVAASAATSLRELAAATSRSALLKVSKRPSGAFALPLSASPADRQAPPHLLALTPSYAFGSALGLPDRMQAGLLWMLVVN